MPTYVGYRVWYGDGSLRSSLDGTWDELPSTDVQFVTFYEDRTYSIYDGVWKTENYVVQFHGQDYYWVEAGQPFAGPATQVPEDLPPGAVKTGRTMADEAYWDLAAQAQDVRVAP